MSVVDDNVEYEGEDREEFEKLSEALVHPGHSGGVLEDGVFQVGELPVSVWNQEDRDEIAVWVDGIFGEGTFASCYRIEVNRPHITAYTYHIDVNGQRHLDNHCKGQSTELGIRPATGLVSQTMIEVFCTGCLKVVGRVPKSLLGIRDYTTLFTNDHTVCSNPPIVALIEE